MGKLTIGSTGLVEINNTSPAKQLDVFGSTALTNALYQITDGIVTYQQYFDGSQCTLQTYSNHPLTFATNNAAPQMSILTNGNVSVLADNVLALSANTLTATTLSGTLSAAARPNITSVETLSSLTVSGSIAGTLSTAAQPNVTSVGTLSSLTVSGAANATVSTAAQPNITSTGNLTIPASLTISNGSSPITCTNSPSSSTFTAMSNSTAANWVNSATASTYGLSLISSVDTNTSQLGCAVAFGNSATDAIPLSAIRMERLSSTSGNMVLSTRKVLLLRMPFASTSDNVDPIIFDVQLYNGSGLTSTNAAIIGTFSNNDLGFQTGDVRKRTLKYSAGYLGFGTTSSGTFLHVNGTASNAFNVGGSLYSQTTSTASTVSQLGPVTVSYPLHFGQRAKENIKQLDESYCENFFKANIFTYNYIGSEETIPKIEFIAQDLNRLRYMNLLTLTPNENMKKVDEDDIEDAQMNIDYNKITVINVFMIKN
ncbi:TPA: hypothetical protein N0F65_001884 [Lagenidium giganteum]|uniref:Peptidase S74 domain-containing protein n=1 Tax=Lagenidium giganteum TaxID=4803 RepID=A0AAV2YY79_9STRA|nr:TPA: hypothetical protein N0F65_001884 [Lagenidium giganteum]